MRFQTDFKIVKNYIDLNLSSSPFLSKEVSRHDLIISESFSSYLDSFSDFDLDLLSFIKDVYVLVRGHYKISLCILHISSSGKLCLLISYKNLKTKRFYCYDYFYDDSLLSSDLFFEFTRFLSFNSFIRVIDLEYYFTGFFSNKCCLKK